MEIKLSENKPDLNKRLMNLNESEDFSLNTIEKILTTKSMQFEFDCGVILGNILVNIYSKFGLNWHYKNTSTFEEFVESVRETVQTSNVQLTKSDIANLLTEYNKLNPNNNLNESAFPLNDSMIRVVVVSSGIKRLLSEMLNNKIKFIKHSETTYDLENTPKARMAIKMVIEEHPRTIKVTMPSNQN